MRLVWCVVLAAYHTNRVIVSEMGWQRYYFRKQVSG
ncbi:hypothetical protein BISU_2458 [Bifidobacterium subtile]|uniref:Uncharacterized protein n=1 Tax=Bifidobacterium subtile TaxID=77635 RepID=A0A087DSY2_9BIFI|nr:hypothetical protein BISU_2458 [Bifidobacterium subtile]